MKGAVIYRGPSMIDGSPIVAIATMRTTNRKTGPMVQTWIMREDVAPHVAVRTGADASVCGSCPHRHSLGGDCYVVPFQAPLSVWKAYHRGSYDADPSRMLEAIKKRCLRVRFGAYGDPGAVPLEAWRRLLVVAHGWAGYTHRWAHLDRSKWGWLMASVDSLSEHIEATARWCRTFGVDYEGVFSGVPCPATTPGSSVTCNACTLCDGAPNDTAHGRHVSARAVYVEPHGSFL